MNRIAFVMLAVLTSTAAAQTTPDTPAPPPAPQAPAPPAPPAPPPMPSAPATPAVPTAEVPSVPAMPSATPAALPDGASAGGLGTVATGEPEQPAEQGPKKPKRGDFDAGGQIRLPNGPDEQNKFATYNWIALDLKGRYFLLDSITANANIPLAVKKPDMLMTGESPSMIGGFTARLDAKIPKTETGLGLTFGYMREGAMLLSDKDYPKFVGEFKPGFNGAFMAKLRLGRLFNFSLVPAWVYQAGTMKSHKAVQLPLSLILRLGSLVETSADLGVYTGDDYSFSGNDGGRIAAGGSVTVKLGPILAHAGLGVASLLTGGAYPTISDSVYIDLNVKYVK